MSRLYAARRGRSIRQLRMPQLPQLPQLLSKESGDVWGAPVNQLGTFKFEDSSLKWQSLWDFCNFFDDFPCIKKMDASAFFLLEV